MDIETNELWAREKMHRVNCDRVFGKKMRGGLRRLPLESQAKNEVVDILLAINWVGRPKDAKKKKAEGPKPSLLVFAFKGSQM